MEIILEIPPQEETRFISRQVVLLAAYDNGSMLLEGRDFQKPERFHLTSQASFPWYSFFQKVFVAWHLSSIKSLPKAFRPQRRIPQNILDSISKLPENALLKVIQELRNHSYLPPLSPKPF